MPFVWWKNSSTGDIYVCLKDYQGPHHYDTRAVLFNERKELECSYSNCLVFHEPSFTNGAEKTYVQNSILADPLCEISIQSDENQKFFSEGIIFGLGNCLHLESATGGSNPTMIGCLIAGLNNDIYKCSDSCVVGSFNICKSNDAFIGGEWCVGYTDALIELGNGYKDRRSDAFYVTKKGDVYCYGDDTSLNAQIDENTAARHTHSNKSVLDATTASYTTAEKTKLSGIEAGAKKNVQSDWNATSGDAYIKNKPTIPDISGKQDKSTAVTHSANTAVGSATKPVYVAANGVATPTSHSINSDVPANAKFTDTTYNDATQSTHGLMTAADKKKLDGLDASRFMNLNNSAIVIYGAGGTAQWYRLGTLVSSGNFNTAIIRILSGDGANGHARQNSSFEIHIKDAWQSTETISAKACGVTVYRINCANAEVKVIPTAHDTYTVWAYLPWGYWNGDYAVYGKYKSWTSQRLTQPDEPEGTAADTAYYDQAFLTSTVAKATEATTLTDSGWSSVTTYIVDKSKFNNISTEFRRIGQIAWVKCSFTPNVAMTSITICDVTKIDPFVAVTPTNAVYGTGSASDGTESFIANISYNPDHKLYLRGNFKPSTIYRLMFSYPVT